MDWISTEELELILLNPQIDEILKKPEKMNFAGDTKLSFDVLYDQDFESYTADYFGFIENDNFKCKNRERIDLSSAKVPTDFVQRFCDVRTQTRFSLTLIS